MTSKSPPETEQISSQTQFACLAGEAQNPKDDVTSDIEQNDMDLWDSMITIKMEKAAKAKAKRS